MKLPQYGFTPEEVEFMAESEPINIIPKISIDKLSLCAVSALAHVPDHQALLTAKYPNRLRILSRASMARFVLR
jgi:hypothetical protein